MFTTHKHAVILPRPKTKSGQESAGVHQFYIKKKKKILNHYKIIESNNGQEFLYNPGQNLVLTMTCFSFWFSVDLITDINLCWHGEVVTAEWRRRDGGGKAPEAQKPPSRTSRSSVLHSAFGKNNSLKCRCIYPQLTATPGKKQQHKQKQNPIHSRPVEVGRPAPWTLKKCLKAQQHSSGLIASFFFFPWPFSFKARTGC